MNDPISSRVDRESLQKISIEDIQSGNIFPDQKIDYSIPVPTQDTRIPQSKQDSWLTIEFGHDLSVLPEDGTNNRGRLGGC